MIKHPDPDYGIVPLAEVEREEILFAIEATGNQLPLAAELLGIGRTTLYRKLRAYGVIAPAKTQKTK